MEERLKLFLSEINSQKVEIDNIQSTIVQKVAGLKINQDNEDLAVNLGYKLHNLYSAYEDLFKLVAGFFENQISDSAKYHIDLLKRMLIEIEGIRPHILTDESFRILDELRGFRHIFRHAYSYTIDSERLMKLAEKSFDLKEVFTKDFNGFKEKLKA